VLSNLVNNALKYSDAGSAIEIAVRRDGAEAHVLATNRGPDIPAAELPNLFDRYFRTQTARESRVRGLGLGLFIARGILEAHDGRIWATSSGGKTTFGFALPLAESA
jgi:signal transduction histidine kinase